MVREDIKITIIKKVEPEYVFGHEVKTNSGNVVQTCPVFKEGDEYISKGMEMPKTFCVPAWGQIRAQISVLFWGGNYDGFLGPGLTYTCCGDGVRPVIFKLERIEDT
ncbi:MAG: TIGR04076 family protein [Candidatus Kariarchaeaceae archaeon]